MNKRVLAPAMAIAIAIAAGSVVAVGNADAKEMTAAELYEPTIGNVYNLGPDEKRTYLVYGDGGRLVSIDLNLFESPYPGLKMERDTSPYVSPDVIKLRLEGGKIYPEQFDVLTGVTVHYDDGSSEYVEGFFTVHPLKSLVAGEPAEPKKPTTTPRATVSVTVTETTTSTEYFPEPYPEPYPVYETETATVTETETEYYPEPYPVYETETATVTKTETSRVTTTSTEYFPEPYPDPYPVYETETVTETETVIETLTEAVQAPAEPVTVTTTAVAAPVTVTEVAAPITKVATVTATPKAVTATATTTVKVTETKEAKVTETVTKTASADNGSSLGTGGVIAIVLGLLAALGAGAFALSGGLPPQLANTLPI